MRINVGFGTKSRLETKRNLPWPHRHRASSGHTARHLLSPAGRSCYHLPSKRLATITNATCGPTFLLRPLRSAATSKSLSFLFPCLPTASASSAAPGSFRCLPSELQAQWPSRPPRCAVPFRSHLTRHCTPFDKVCPFRSFSFFTWTTSATSPCFFVMPVSAQFSRPPQLPLREGHLLL